MVSSETTIKYLEEDIASLEGEIAELTVERQTKEQQKPVDMDKMKAYVRHFLAHLDELLLHHSNPVLQAKYFGVIFNEPPTYEDIVSGTPDCSKITGVNEVFKRKKSPLGLMAGEEGLEPPLSGPKPDVLPLDDSPSNRCDYSNCRRFCIGIGRLPYDKGRLIRMPQ